MSGTREANLIIDEIADAQRRYKRALEAIKRHHDMPDGESWEQAYNEVCSFAIEALES